MNHHRNLVKCAEGVRAAGCSKWPSSKAGASEAARRTFRYVEPLNDARTKLADFFSILLEKVCDFVRKMTGVALAVQQLATIFGFPIMTPETVGQGPLSKIGPFRMVWIPRLVVGVNMASWNHRGIPLDWPVMHDTGMAGRAPFPLLSRSKRLHMLPMVHDEADVFHRRRQIPRRDLGHPHNTPMTTQAATRIYTGFQIVHVGWRAEHILHRIPDPRPHLVVHPAFDSRPHMARHTRDIFMRRCGPTLVRRRNGMAAGAEFRLVRHGNGDSTESHRSGHKAQYNRTARFPTHALIEHDGENTS